MEHPFDLVNPFGIPSGEMKLIGKFSVYNVFASIATSVVSGIPIESYYRFSLKK